MGVLEVGLRRQLELVILPEIVDRLSQSDETKQALPDELLDRDLFRPFQRGIVSDIHVLRDHENLVIRLDVFPAHLIGPVVVELPARQNGSREKLQILLLGKGGDQGRGLYLRPIECLQDAGEDGGCRQV